MPRRAHSGQQRALTFRRMSRDGARADPAKETRYVEERQEVFGVDGILDRRRLDARVPRPAADWIPSKAFTGLRNAILVTEHDCVTLEARGD
jgi:hypothetical protein